MIGAATPAQSPHLVDRAGRHTLVAPLPHRYSADNTAQAVTAAFRCQPAEMLKTLTRKGATTGNAR